MQTNAYAVADVAPHLDVMLYYETIGALADALSAEHEEQPNADYERGFVDGMQKQMQRSVDRAVNRMADALEQPEPGGVCARCGGWVCDPVIAKPEQEWLTGCPSCGMDSGCDCEALEQPEQEPVAWIQSNHLQQAQREPFLCRVEPTPRLPDFVPLYTAPPRREWRGLTDEERRDIREWKKIQEELGPVWAPMMLYLYLAIEAALKEKNHE